jgi:hypothetical protein
MGSLGPVIWLFVVLAALCSFVVAAVSVGSVTARLSTRARRSVYDLDEAVSFVADRLPPEITAQASYDDVRAVLEWHIAYLADKGVLSYKTADDPGSGLILVSDDEPVAYILGRIDDVDADAPGASLTDEQVVVILDAEARYYESIGAIGPRVPAPEL